MRRALGLLAAGALLAGTAATPAAAQDPGGGTQVGGSVESTLTLGLEPAGGVVTAYVSSTEPGARLSVVPAGRRTDLSARLTGRFAAVDPLQGLQLMAWHDVLAGRAAVVRLRSSSATPSTALVTLSAPTP